MAETVDVWIERLGWSVATFAERAALSLDRAQAIVDGRWTPSPQERDRIAAALQTSLPSIIWGHTMSPRVVRYRRCGLPEHLASDTGKVEGDV